MGSLRVVTFKIDETLLEELDRYAARVGLARSDVIRKAIIEYIRGGSKERKTRLRIRKVVVD